MDDDRPRLPDGTWAPGGPPPPNRGRRRKGIANKITRDLKSGMIDSAIEHGRDGNGLDGLKGFCAYLLRTDLKAYCSILGRMIPINVQGDVAVGITSVNIVSVLATSYRNSNRWFWVKFTPLVTGVKQQSEIRLNSAV
jgi:hypothetical protein